MVIVFIDIRVERLVYKSLYVDVHKYFWITDKHNFAPSAKIKFNIQLIMYVQRVEVGLYKFLIHIIG